LISKTNLNGILLLVYGKPSDIVPRQWAGKSIDSELITDHPYN